MDPVMERREFMALVAGGIVAAARAAETQQASVPRLCVLAADSLSSPWASRYNAFILGRGRVTSIRTIISMSSGTRTTPTRW